VVRDGVTRVLRVLFVAYIAATALHIGLVLAHEPFVFDAWNVALDTHAAPFTWARFFDYGVFEYAHANPRLGQWLTYLAYKLEWFAPIAMPLAYFALAGAVSVLGLGRWPRRGRELALVAIAIGCAWFALPRIGMIMFCRAYGMNYLCGAAIQLWFLVPLRLRPTATAGWLACAAYLVLGLIAGMCNEHTGPTLVLFMLGYAVWRGRIGRTPTLAWAGAIGSVIGFSAIFFAPGQGSRYDGLATKMSLLGRLIQRGVTGNLDIFRDWMIACAPVLGLIVIAMVIARRDEPARASDSRDAPLRLVGLALVAGTLVTATVFVSPKLGPRFFLCGAALVLAGFVAVADRALTTTRRLAPFVVLAVVASAYAVAHSVPLYLRVSAASDARLAALAKAPPGSVFTAEAYEEVENSWWSLGDDLRDVNQRALVASYFDLRGVVFRALDPEAPLGVSDVRLVPRAQIAPASSLDDHGGFELDGFRGLDVGTITAAMQAAIDRVRTRLGDAGRLERLELAVEFLGASPRLPRPRVLIGRWRPDGLEAYPGAIERQGRSTTRAVRLPEALRRTDLEIYAYVVGGEARRLGTARDAKLAYVPWSRGAYWALACRTDECFVIAAARLL